MKEKRVLFICPRPIFPVVWGERIRYYNNLSILFKKYKIDLLIVYAKESEKKNSIMYKDKLYINQFFFKQSGIRSILQVLIALFTREPLQVAYFYNPLVAKWVKKNYVNYDIIFCNNIRTAKYVIGLDCYKVLDYVDAISMNYQRAGRTAKGLRRIMYKIEYSRLLQYERAMLDEFARTLIISEKDRCHILEGYIKKDIVVIPNYVDNMVQDDGSNVVKYRIGFVGKMNYEPNVLAAEYFAKNIFPIIKKKILNSSFYIIGGNPSERISGLRKVCRDIYVTGFVDDVYSEMSKCDLIVAPMLTGAGLQNKIIQAMMLGKCVITTSIGKAGLPGLLGNELCVVDDTEEFRKMVILYLSNPDKKKNIENRAHQYAKKYFSFEEVANSLLNII